MRSKQEDSKSAEETRKDSSKAGARAKGVKALKPQSDPEFFPDKRNLVISISLFDVVLWTVLQFESKALHQYMISLVCAIVF